MNSLLDKQNVVMLFILTLLVLLTIWMQFVLLEKPETLVSSDESNDPDYYVENFTSFGIDDSGRQYQLEADRLVHYPMDNKALLDRPHITQIDPKGNPTHIYADSGWLFSDGSEILLTENVKVIRSAGLKIGGAATTKRMRIKLKPKDKS